MPKAYDGSKQLVLDKDPTRGLTFGGLASDDLFKGVGTSILKLFQVTFDDLWKMLGFDTPPQTPDEYLDALDDFIEQTAKAIDTWLASQIPGLDASKITSGLFPQNMISGLEQELSDLGAAIASGDPAAIIEAITGIVDGTTDDLETWSDNLLSMLGLPPLNDAIFDAAQSVEQFIIDMMHPQNLLAPMNPSTQQIFGINIPGLDASKITSGQFPQSMVNIVSIAASTISGVLAPLNIPGLDASKIQSGIMSLLQIPGLPASQITSGAFAAGQIPSLDASKIGSGIFAQSMVNITNIAAGIVSGVLGTPQIPALDATKITTGAFATARIPDVTRAMSTDLQATQDHILNGLVGGPGYAGAGTAVPPSQARGGLDKIYNEILNHTARLQELSSDENAAGVSGISITLNFSDYPDGALPAHFSVTYTGAGTSLLGVTSGQGGWRTRVNDANRSARGAYNLAPTQTDFQIIRGTLGGLPEQGSTGGTPKIGVMGRLNSAATPTTFVWGRGYCTGFLTYKGEMGCTVNNVETVWVSNISLNWSTDIRCVFGVGIQPRRYQFYSGSSLIYDYTEVGTVSQLGAGFRYFGLTCDICTGASNTTRIPGTLANAAISDNGPPTVVGSGARMIRQNTAGVNFSAGQAQTDFPGNYFDSIQAASADIQCTLATNRIEVNKDGWYVITLSVEVTSSNSARLALGIKRNNAMWQWGAAHYQANPTCQSSWVGYLVDGDYITPVYANTDGISSYATRGQADGQKTSFSIALANRSYA